MRSIAIQIGLLLALAPGAWAADPALRDPATIDLQVLTTETQQLAPGSDRMILVWWLPQEFWSASYAQDPTSSPAQREAILDVVRPYTLVAIADGDMGPLGGVTYRTAAETRQGLRLADVDNTQFAPIPDEQLSPDSKNLVSMMRPVLANMLGPLGENLHIYFFPSRGPGGKLIANATGPGSFTVTLREERFTWRLPLGSLLTPKKCPVDGELLNGAWTYCPWHGAKLER